MMKFIEILATGLLSACAANSGVVSVGRDMFMISKQAATGFGGMGNLKAKALTGARLHCAAQNQNFEVVSSTESKPPYILANYPRVEITFRCIPR